MWSNCYLFAIQQWYRHGGYIVLTKSQYGWWPHAFHSEDLRRFTDFVPLAPKRRRWLPPLVFRGHIKIWIVEENT